MGIGYSRRSRKVYKHQKLKTQNMYNLFRKIFFRKRYEQLIEAQKMIEPYLDASRKKDDKLSIAFCISGHVRDYRRLTQNYIEFKNLISTYGDVDVFVATWNKQNSANCWSAAHGLSEPGSHEIDIDAVDIIKNFDAKLIDINNYEFYASQFSPLQCSNLSKTEYNWDGRGIYNGVVGSSKMFYLIYRANLLKLQQEYANGKEYDWVFRLRPDMKFDIEMCKTVMKLDMLDNTKLHMPGPNNDKIAYGGSQVMNKYSNTLFRMISQFDNGIFGPPETITANTLLEFIKRENIIDSVIYGSLLAEHKRSLLPYR